MFTPLSMHHMGEIVEKMLSQLRQRLAYQEIDLTLDEDAIQWLATNGYDPIYGARPLMRFITKELETPIAKKIIAGEILPNSEVRVSFHEDHLEFSSKEKE